MSTITTDVTPVQPVVVTPAVPANILANARELDDIREVIKVAEKREKELRAQILDHLESIGEDAIAQDGVAISLSRSVRTGVDTKRLEALYPKVHADVKTSTPVTQVRVKVKG